jgi:hypothetical protein
MSIKSYVSFSIDRGLGLGKSSQGRLLPVEAVSCSGLGQPNQDPGDVIWFYFISVNLIWLCYHIILISILWSEVLCLMRALTRLFSDSTIPRIFCFMLLYAIMKPFFEKVDSCRKFWTVDRQQTAEAIAGSCTYRSVREDHWTLNNGFKCTNSRSRSGDWTWQRIFIEY